MIGKGEIPCFKCKNFRKVYLDDASHRGACDHPLRDARSCMKYWTSTNEFAPHSYRHGECEDRTPGDPQEYRLNDESARRLKEVEQILGASTEPYRRLILKIAESFEEEPTVGSSEEIIDVLRVASNE